MSTSPTSTTFLDSLRSIDIIAVSLEGPAAGLRLVVGKGVPPSAAGGEPGDHDDGTDHQDEHV